MTITYSLDHVSTTVEDVSVEVADKSNLVLQSTSTDPKTGDVTSIYVVSTGDNAYPAYVTYRVAVQKRAAGVIRRMSMTFDTWAVKSDSVTGIDTREPISGTISINAPANMTIETADLDDFIGNLFSFLYDSVTVKARNTTWLSKLLFGVPQVK